MEILYQTQKPIILTTSVNGSLVDADSSVTVVTEDGTFEAERFALGRYSFTPEIKSPGIYKVTWQYEVNNKAYSKIDNYQVVIGYCTPEDFRDTFTEFDDISDEEIFRKESLARKIINAWCGQSFGFDETTRKVYGAGKKTLALPKKISILESVVDWEGTDITNVVDIYQDKWLIHTESAASSSSRFFLDGRPFFVQGTWGWTYVPEDISYATKILIRDYFDDDHLLREHGVVAARLGDRDIRFEQPQQGGSLFATTTGNYDVDTLLYNYMDIGLDIV